MAETQTNKIISPQEGFQTNFLSNSADILIAGSGAGVGKTYALLLEPLRHITTVEGFGGVIFRRTTPQIKNEGGLWDTSVDIYSMLGASSAESSLKWTFPRTKNKLKFSHLEYEKDKLSFQGSQIPFIGFDELTHFTEGQFFYMLSRNRSVCGVKPYIRATCNPDPDSWVAHLISWWIDQDTGFPIPERDGKLRYFIKKGSDYIWGDTKNEVVELARDILKPFIDKGENPEDYIKSLSFVKGSIYDNQKLLKEDPSYIANLLSQPEEVRAQLLDGNWKHVENDLDLFSYSAFSCMFDNSFSVKNGKRYITADIALEGADKFIVCVWDGFEMVDISIIDKNNGKDVIDTIKKLASEWKVSNNRIVYDNDGVGGFLGGFVPQGYPFKNGGKVFGKENYPNLKTQCYYWSAKRVNEGGERGYIISEKVANTMYDNKTTVRQRFMFERKGIKRDKVNDDGKLTINSKSLQKIILQGQSPDLMDAFMMREFFAFNNV